MDQYLTLELWNVMQITMQLFYQTLNSKYGNVAFYSASGHVP